MEEEILHTSEVPRQLSSHHREASALTRSIGLSSIKVLLNPFHSSNVPTDRNTVEQLLSKEISKTLQPYPADLISAWWDWLSCDGTFSQENSILPFPLLIPWGLFLGMIQKLPFPVLRILQQQVRLKLNNVVSATSTLVSKCNIVNIEDKPRKTKFNFRVTCGSEESPEAMVADLFYAIPKPKSQWGPKEKRDPFVVSENAELLGKLQFQGRSGSDYARLSGDSFPIHTSKVFAKAVGLKTYNMQGMGTLALAMNLIVHKLCGGDQAKLREIDVAVTSPNYLPNTVSVYVQEESIGDHKLWVCSQDKKRFYLAGSFRIN